MNNTIPDTRKVFLKQGTCSRTFCYLLNREFGCSMETEERAADPLAGGVLLRGHQCGMLWGSALAAGAESFRRHGNSGQAVAAAISAAQHIMASYTRRTGSIDCRDVTGCDFTRRLDLLKYIIKFMLFIDRSCFDLAEQWAPEAAQAAAEGLSLTHTCSLAPVSCASEVVKKMGGSDREQVMAAGFAGGLGLSGGGCGALAAAIWMKSLAWSREHPGKSPYKNPYAKKTLQAFLDAAGPEMLCHKIAGRRFKTVDEHTEFMTNGGCDRLIDMLAGA